MRFEWKDHFLPATGVCRVRCTNKNRGNAKQRHRGANQMIWSRAAFNKGDENAPIEEAHGCPTVLVEL
jgi:hypothetical protein